jgi:probable rRNA maturation factor
VKLELVLDDEGLAWVPDSTVFDRLARLVTNYGPTEFILQVVLTDDATLLEHNRDYREKDRPTDVLSFSYFDGHQTSRHALLRGEVDASQYLEFCHPDEEVLAGQILVSLETLQDRGPLHAASLDDELAFMAIHGLLHVLGFDHGTDAEAEEMQALELELMKAYVSLSDLGGQKAEI